MLNLGLARFRPAAWTAVLLGALLAVAGVTLAIDRQADHHLAADAERAALAWARHMAVHVPDIDLVFAGDLPSTQAQDRLTSLRGTAGLFRFKLYDTGGRLLVVSESVATAPRPRTSQKPTRRARPRPRARARSASSCTAAAPPATPTCTAKPMYRCAMASRSSAWSRSTWTRPTWQPPRRLRSAAPR